MSGTERPMVLSNVAIVPGCAAYTGARKYLALLITCKPEGHPVVGLLAYTPCFR